jgi:copper chaperone CopZ
MKFPAIGGAIFLLSGIGALAAIALSGASQDSSGAAATAAAEPAAPAVETPDGAVVYSVPDMHCEFACAPKVRETLQGIAGVEKVETNVENQTVTIFTNGDFNTKTALAALSEAGYPGQPLSK